VSSGDSLYSVTVTLKLSRDKLSPSNPVPNK
jgi:hypothetical protein